MSKFDVVALGELLIDFSKKGVGLTGNPVFEANPGGAPCNVLSMLGHLGKKTTFLGKVGKDFLGDFLADTLKEQGIDTTNLSRDENVPTTLAFVDNAPDGDRSFSFYRNPGADMMLREEDIDFSVLDSSSIFHFGTLSLTDSGIEQTTKTAVQYAKNKGLLISFDPNLRPPLWKDLNRAKDMMAYGMSVCDILKISDNEIEFFTGTDDIEAGINMLNEQYHPKLICATMGKEGSIALYKKHKVKCEAFLQERTVDTTGAGDTFMACILNHVLELGIENLNESNLKHMLVFANAAASIITTRIGALKAMPTRSEVESFLLSKNVNEVNEVKLKLNTIDKIKEFVSIISSFEGEFLIKSERYVIDAKSIMGIFSLDLSKPLLLDIEATPVTMEEILDAIREYVV